MHLNTGSVLLIPFVISLARRLHVVVHDTSVLRMNKTVVEKLNTPGGISTFSINCRIKWIDDLGRETIVHESSGCCNSPSSVLGDSSIFVL